jgi:ubiquinone/menaquinone biosynthesis C-methylase UbiE
MNNFDRIAPIYDKLASIVFGKAMRRAQTKFLNEIRHHSRVLILGGGTGWLLAELLSTRPDCQVIYIEASEKMIDMARKRIDKSHNVSFIHGTEKEIPAASSFEVVITHFYLDLFEQRSCLEVCTLIRRYCHPGSLWIASDFVNNVWWQSILLRSMYTFFGLTTRLHTKSLPEWRTCIQEAGFSEIGVGYYSGDFICSALYRLETGRGEGSSGQIFAKGV